MKIFNLKNIMKCFLVVGLLLCSITPAFANETKSNIPDVKVIFESEIPCDGLPEPSIVKAESETSVKVTMPKDPVAKGYIFKGFVPLRYDENGELYESSNIYIKNLN